MATTAATPVLAQSGGFAARPSGSTRQIDVRAAGTIEYNDNVVLSDPRISGGGTKGDVILSPTLNLNILLPRATGDVYLAGSLGYRFYTKYTGLNREFVTLTGGADQRLASCLVHGEANYNRSLTDLGNLYVQDAAGSFRNTEESRQISADVGCSAPLGLRPALAYSHSQVRNTLALRQFADSDTDSFTAQLGLPTTPIGTFSVFGRMSDSRYVRRVTPTGGRDGIKTYAAGVQFERMVGNRLNFTGSANYIKVDPKLPGTKSFSGVGYSVSGLYRGEDYSISLTGSRNAEPSVIYFVSYNITTTLSLSATKELSERLRVSVGAARTWRDFTASTLFPNALIAGHDKTSSLSATATYIPSRRLSFSLTGAYNDRSTNTQLFKYRAKRIALTTSLAL
ncbi:gellan polysaccharide biosynthesis protein GelF [Sphingomonas sp. TDK1]|nr:gellan polysaccharide biosynthesis protein GelF [Sphingomonas sp. TDK1]